MEEIAMLTDARLCSEEARAYKKHAYKDAAQSEHSGLATERPENP
jgi:hypothetical protein